MQKDLLNQVQNLFEHSYGTSTHCVGVRRFFSPARINLIGEHIDYCGGRVFPAAVQFGTVIIARPNGLGTVRAVSINEPGAVEFEPAGHLQAGTPTHWGDYVKGIVVEYGKVKVDVPGLDLAIGGDIPGGGLSSSASLEVGIAVMIEAFTGYASSDDHFANRQALSWLAQRAENDFVGVNCGIMDQGAIALGKKNQAMLMDCNNLAVSYFPVELGDYSLLIVNSCKQRRLGESAYNSRREEVERALSILQPVFGIAALCELPIDLLDDALDRLDDPLLCRRVRHVVSEQERVSQAADRLSKGDINGFGKLLDASHRSLQLDYEVTGHELDTLIGLAQEQPGVLGARMMGAGFGGCGLVLLETSAIEQFSRVVGTAYRAKIGY
ncbi:MAG: galactokinase, partial [Candidatus Azotimanducaceae bacterium WSBS_2022_MAG_OTU7]